MINTYQWDIQSGFRLISCMDESRLTNVLIPYVFCDKHTTSKQEPHKSLKWNSVKQLNLLHVKSKYDSCSQNS